MATHSSQLVAPRALHVASARGWRRGFANLLRKENSLWWGTRKWLVHALIWVAIINGIISLGAFDQSMGPVEMVQELTTVFFKLGAAALAVGLITSVQGAIVGERQLGTAAWLMSKPASRSAFVLSKLVANALAFVVVAVALPAAVFYAQSWLMHGHVAPPAAFLAGLGVAIVHLLFYLALTLMLGTLFARRGPVAGIGLGVLLGGLVLPSFLPGAVVMFTPWVLPDVMASLALGGELPAIWPIPVAVTALASALFVGVALWRFGRENF